MKLKDELKNKLYGNILKIDVSLVCFIENLKLVQNLNKKYIEKNISAELRKIAECKNKWKLIVEII